MAALRQLPDRLPDSANRSNSQELRLRNFDFSPYIQDDIKLSPSSPSISVYAGTSRPRLRKQQFDRVPKPHGPNPPQVEYPVRPQIWQLRRVRWLPRADIHWGHIGPRLGLPISSTKKQLLSRIQRRLPERRSV